MVELWWVAFLHWLLGSICLVSLPMIGRHLFPCLATIEGLVTYLLCGYDLPKVLPLIWVKSDIAVRHYWLRLLYMGYLHLRGYRPLAAVLIGWSFLSRIKACVTYPFSNSSCIVTKFAQSKDEPPLLLGKIMTQSSTSFQLSVLRYGLITARGRQRAETLQEGGGIRKKRWPRYEMKLFCPFLFSLPKLILLLLSATAGPVVRLVLFAPRALSMASLPAWQRKLSLECVFSSAHCRTCILV